MESYQTLLNKGTLALIHRHPLFTNMTDSEIVEYLSTVKPGVIEMEPSQRITVEPGFKRRLGVVIEGVVRVLTVDYGGNKTIINVLQDHGNVGTMQFMADHYNMLFEIVADTASRVIMFDADDFLKPITGIERIQYTVLVNLMVSQRQLFITLSEHLVCLSQKNIRDKLLHYLQIRSEKAHSYEFDIPLSREDLAAYLAVDRASLARALGELRREGILEFRKNHFKILSTQHFQY